MQSLETSASSTASTLPNGPGAAALLSAGIGACALAVLSIAADRLAGFQRWMVFSKPTGSLSGVTTSAIVIWLIAWGILELRWRNRNVPMNRIGIAALILLIVGLLLTFPPLADAL
ncbi:MAG: hypothetical protein WCF17_18440 [Terracidiphilus sp.]